MSADEMPSNNLPWNRHLPWSQLEDAAAAHFRPGLAGRVLAEAGRVRAEAAESRRGLRSMALAAVSAALLLGGYHHYNTRAVTADRAAQWSQVAAWTNEFAAN